MKRTLLNLLLIALCIGPFTANAQSIIRTIAGTGAFGDGFSGNNGPAVNAPLGGLYGVCVDTAGNVYFTDQYNYVVRRIDKNGIVKTIAGTGFPGYTGDGGPASAARVSVVQPIICDRAGNLYIGDAGNKVVRKINTAGIISTVAGNPTVLTYGTGDGGPATNAGLGSTAGLALDAAGNLYIADGNTRIRKVNTAGIISTIAGGSIGYSGNGGPATAASMDGVTDLAFDRFGNLFVTEKNNSTIRKINTSGIITAYAGTAGSFGSIGDGGPATACRFNSVSSLAFDSAGTLYVTDQLNNRIRKINTSNVISLYAGAVGGFAGDGAVPSNTTKFSQPTGICFDKRGNMYIVDKGSGAPGGQPWGRRIREIFKVDTFSLSVTPSPVLCGNTFAAFTAHPTAAYYSYVYKWYRNGVPVGSNLPTWSSPSINNNDTITCTLVDTANGGMLLAVSTPIIMTVLPPILPELHVVSTGDTVCNGLAVTYTATAVNGGTAPIFKWYRFGTLLGTGPVFTYIPATGDIITCELVSNDPCAFPNTVHVDMPLSVIPSFLPTVIINASSDTVISFWGQIITFFTNVTYGGSDPTYQWYNSAGPIPGATSSSYFQEIYAADDFYCVMHSNAYCAVPEIDTSNIVHISTGTVGVANQAAVHSSFGIYPNPNSGQFTVKCTINTVLGKDVVVEVQNVLGQSLYRNFVSGGTASVSLPVNLADASPGLYYLVVYDNNGRRAVPFIIR